MLTNLLQESLRTYLETDYNNDLMIPVFSKIFYSFLVPLDKDIDMDSVYVNLVPQFNSEGDYLQFGNTDNIEPLVIEQYFHDIKPNQLEILEDFRLLNNLYREESRYLDLKKDIVVEFKDECVLFNRKYLKKYLAARQMILVTSIHSVITSSSFDDDEDINYSDENLCYKLSIRSDDDVTYSILNGRKLMKGASIETCGYWPYEDEKIYEEFIIGHDADGEDIKFTCNPLELTPEKTENPPFLTPVFFKKELMQKYYDCDKCEVTDAYIKFANLWFIYVDNPDGDYFSAYLGDIGERLPHAEQDYWRSFNVSPYDKKLSSTKIKRDFSAEFTASESQIQKFKDTYNEFNKAFQNKKGWPFFLELETNDKYCFDKLRIPLSTSSEEFNSLVISLTKILIDSLNENKISSEITTTPDMKGITKLETWFNTKGIQNYESHIASLRNLYDFRSRSEAHRKSRSSYSKLLTDSGFTDEMTNKEKFSLFILRSQNFLDFLIQNNDNFV